MPREKSQSEAAVVATGLAMGESLRWHDGRLWVSDFGGVQLALRIERLEMALSCAWSGAVIEAS